MKNELTHLPDTQRQEMERAFAEKRQPRCVHCGRPLERLYQESTRVDIWEWDEQQGIFVHVDGEGTGTEKPVHDADPCYAEDWEFMTGPQWS